MATPIELDFWSRDTKLDMDWYTIRVLRKIAGSIYGPIAKRRGAKGRKHAVAQAMSRRMNRHV